MDGLLVFEKVPPCCGSWTGEWVKDGTEERNSIFSVGMNNLIRKRTQER